MNLSKAWSRKHAIVIGSSIAGMLTARMLSDHFQRVTIVERDEVSKSLEGRKGVPQGQHVHVIFSGGMRVINQLFPGFSDELAANGSVVCDFAKELCWYHAGVWKARPESGLTSYWQTRPFLEANLRRRLQRDREIQVLEDCPVVGLLANADRTHYYRRRDPPGR